MVCMIDPTLKTVQTAAAIVICRSSTASFYYDSLQEQLRGRAVRVEANLPGTSAACAFSIASA